MPRDEGFINNEIMGEFWKHVRCNAHPWSKVNSLGSGVFQCLACLHEQTCGECAHRAMMEMQSVHCQVPLVEAKAVPAVAKNKVRRKARKHK